MADPDEPRFWIGRFPGAGTRLPYVLRLPVSGEGRIFLAARETWPRGTDVFCYQLPSWPDEADVIDEVPIEACWRVGAAVHLVLRRRANRRSLFVWTKKGERTLVFWRSDASMRRARPGIRVPLARGFGERLSIVVDLAEKYPWRFAGREVTTERRSLPVGDYALVRDDEIVAVVERKTPADLATAAIGGQLGLALAELGQTRHAALVVEGRLSDVLKAGERTRPGWLLNVLAALQAEHPRVSWMFAETRQLAEEWAYRWLAASARIDAPRALPLLDERAIGEIPITYGGRPRMLDATARRSLLLQEAERGTVWTSRTAATRCGVTQVTALADLNALARAGRIAIVGRGRSRSYRALAGAAH
ncbi:MAG TPA: ERCC4 domain-containing protein [Candidatus Limnocylindria bacterium]|nr:ERCC4 domain-containing protein [Candidatus Limnocylindria bacterium]